MATTPPPIGSSSFNPYANSLPTPQGESSTTSPSQKRKASTGLEENLPTRATSSDESANKRPRTALPVTQSSASKTSKEIAKDIIENAPNLLNKNQKTQLRNFQKWLDKHHAGTTLADIRDGCGTAGAYGNSLVVAWLDAPAEENPYGRDAQKKGQSGNGAAAVTALLKSYGKPF